MLKNGLLYGLTFLAISATAAAQTFSAADLKPLESAAETVPLPAAWQPQAASESLDAETMQLNQAFVTKDTAPAETDNPLSRINQALQQPKSKPVADTPAKQDDIFIPEGELYRLDTPTIDGSERGGQAFVEVDKQGRMKKVSQIFLFYDEFRIYDYSASTVSCDVRFNILSNLDQKINQLDVKLVWPEMTTTLSFSDVAPNTQTYYNYSLLGNGCYSMDKMPNIIVNRCRVKGMTSAECANKLIWLSR